ncbi:hypothetical protein, partial [uncultured Fibrobacter sp.]|uniref:hypothetical protein n=1 Tax=uncultured Fibrobacter sp. TaxID=261512 RepID=UPI002639DD4C
MAVTLESLRKTIGKKNSSSRAFAWLADLECAAGDLDSALQRVDGGLTLYPSDVAAMLVRAKILLRKESFETCIQECEHILLVDPFNLAAQRIMGDAYDKLGNEGERNRCYRRVHDMDPLNTFWKDEYDVVIESAAAAAGLAAADEFTMPVDDEFNMDQTTTTESSPEQPVEAAAAETGDASESFELPAVEGDSDDPFASLAAMIPNGDVADESAIDDLSASLASVMENIDTPSAETDVSIEDFGSDDNISSSDVNSAIADMFGADDDLEPEAAVPAKKSIFSETSIPASIDEMAEEPTPVDETPVDKAPIDEVPVEDKPQSVDNAFDSIFGEDELPEEKTDVFEKSAEEDKPQSVDNAFDSIFGIDELPEEKSENVEKPAEEDKPQSVDNAFDSIFGEDELPEEKTDVFEKSAEEDKPQSVDKAFDSIFGEDELPAENGGLFEKSADEEISFSGEWSPDPVKKSSSVSEEPQAEVEEGLSVAENDEALEMPSIEESVEEKPAAVEETSAEFDAPKSVDSAFDSIFGDDELPEEKPAESLAEPAMEELSEPVEKDLELPAEKESVSLDETDSVASTVDNAFDSLFGDDELPAENAAEDKPAEVETAGEKTSLAEQMDLAETELELPEAKAEQSDIAKEMGGAFASMFGDDDDDLDLPTANTSESTAVNDQEATGAAIEENEDLVKEDIEKDLDKSFDSLFGEDDDLTLPETPAATDTVENAVAEEKPVTEESADLDSLETEVSGAFKGLFDMDDDSLAEEDKPSNSGVDFLMSGDSDDEISAGLIDNPDAPLDRGATKLDESLNTRTLAEIYFDQGLYGKALEIYRDLAQKEPENKDIAARLSEVENLYNGK